MKAHLEMGAMGGEQQLGGGIGHIWQGRALAVTPEGVLSREDLEVPTVPSLGRLLELLVAAVSRGQRCRLCWVYMGPGFASGTSRGSSLPTVGKEPTPALLTCSSQPA